MITLELSQQPQPNISSKWWLILLFWIIVWCWKYTWTSSGHTVIHPSLNNRLRIYKYSSTVSNNILRSLQCNRFVGETVKLWDSISVVSTWNQVWICWWSLVREIWTTCCTKPGQLYVHKLKLVELSFDAFIWSQLVWDKESKKQSTIPWIELVMTSLPLKRYWEQKYLDLNSICLFPSQSWLSFFTLTPSYALIIN